MIKKILFSTLLPSCVFLTTLLFPAASAKAQTLPVKATCVGPLTLQFSPGLGLLPRPTHLTGSGMVTCVFTDDLSTHTALVEDLDGFGNLSCLINTDTPGSFRLDWDDTTSSVVNWTFLKLGELGLPAVPRVFVLQGEIVSGKFEGSDVVLSYNDIPNLAYLKCLSGNLDKIQGIPTGTITQPLPSE
ncbi:hypothetical protein [Luteimonas sp. R10]|uniref:hypothetical protein n=1 Tax=Luteimonas sp. R10 TaxID=3108176 RepID=UPI0030881460|nr:hypothetical protein U3649_11015 [Luteimonas sp. R10]